MNDKGIIAATVAFVVILSFCTWFSFSERIISPGELLERAGIVAAIFAVLLGFAAISHHYSAH